MKKRITVGLDLDARMSEACVLDGRGVVARRERLRTTPEGVRAVFEPMPHALVALEVGTHSPWVSRVHRAGTGPGPGPRPYQARLVTPFSSYNLI